MFTEVITHALPTSMKYLNAVVLVERDNRAVLTDRKRSHHVFESFYGDAFTCTGGQNKKAVRGRRSGQREESKSRTRTSISSVR